MSSVAWHPIIQLHINPQNIFISMDLTLLSSYIRSEGRVLSQCDIFSTITSCPATYILEHPYCDNHSQVTGGPAVQPIISFILITAIFYPAIFAVQPIIFLILILENNSNLNVPILQYCLEYYHHLSLLYSLQRVPPLCKLSRQSHLTVTIVLCCWRPKH